MVLRSHAWSFFDQIIIENKKYGKCHECLAPVVCTEGGTSGLIKHLRKHSSALEEFNRLKLESSKTDVAHIIENLDPLHNESIKDNCENEPAETDPKFNEFEFKEPELENQIEDEKEEAIANEKLILQSGDFKSELLSVFKELANDEVFTNVTIVAAGGKTIEAHKVVLSAFSPFFKELLVKNHHQHPLIYLRGVSYTNLKAIIDFIYFGQAKVDANDLPDFMALASDLQIKGLRSNYVAKEKVELTNAKSIVVEHTEEPRLNFNPQHNNYDCTYCEYHPKTKEDLMMHIESKHVANALFCNFCEFFSESENILTKHKLKKHKSSKFLSHNI